MGRGQHACTDENNSEWCTEPRTSNSPGSTVLPSRTAWLDQTAQLKRKAIAHQTAQLTRKAIAHSRREPLLAGPST